MLFPHRTLINVSKYRKTNTLISLPYIYPNEESRWMVKRMEKRQDQGEKHNDAGVKSAKSAKRDEVVPGIELGLPESESDVLTITLYNQVAEANSFLSEYISKKCCEHSACLFNVCCAVLIGNGT
jgi:hypothetical protein